MATVEKVKNGGGATAATFSKWHVSVPGNRPSPVGHRVNARSWHGHVTVPPRIVYGCLRFVGFSRAAALTMTAICGGESGYYLDVWRWESNGSVSDSVWQLNSVHGYSVRACYNLLAATRLAHNLYRAGGFSPWGAYNNGSYRRHMATARAAQKAWEKGSKGGGSVPQSGSTLVLLSKSRTCGGRTLYLRRRWKARAESIARQYHCCISSAYRTAAHNTEVGGAPKSDHLCGNACDFAGSPYWMATLARWASTAGFAYVEHEGDHVHISFARCGSSAPPPGPGPQPQPVSHDYPRIEHAWDNFTTSTGRLLPLAAQRMRTLAESFVHRVS